MVDKVRCGCNKEAKATLEEARAKGYFALPYTDPDICIQFGGDYFCNEDCYRRALQAAGFKTFDSPPNP